ncbi:BnaA03g12440D [Brassica napus]|uniref:BnaA03g12440D protein n=1 Tax=Brassica napus TaxID=3708 RepID=A0A078JFG9_BRANA|nr:BnaA03g12440D [Brassica napus]
MVIMVLRVKSLLKRHEKQLHTLANALLEYETLTAEDINRILPPSQEAEKLLEQQEVDLVLALVTLFKNTPFLFFFFCFKRGGFKAFVHSTLNTKQTNKTFATKTKTKIAGKVIDLML